MLALHGNGFATIPAALGDRIRAARRARSWTQQALAAHVGVTVTTISRWERGMGAPRGRLLRALSQALDRRLDVPTPAVRGWPRGRRVEAAAERIGRALREIAAELRVAP